MADPQPVTDWREVDIGGIPYRVRTHPDEDDDIICAVRPWGGRPPGPCKWKAYHFPPNTDPGRDSDAYRVDPPEGGRWDDVQLAMDAADAARLAWEPEYDTEGTEYPVCPSCGLADQDWWDGLTIEVNDGTEWERHCHDCGADYTVTAHVDITFATEPKEAPHGS